jgi:hypothetical protein
MFLKQDKQANYLLLNRFGKMKNNVKCAMQAVKCFVNHDVLNRNLYVWLFYSR